MVAGVFAELARERPRRRFTIGINDDVSGTSLAYDAGARHRAARDGARGLLRPRLGRHGRREQEHDQDPRRRRGPARAGLLRLRLEEVRLADRLAPALRAAADPRALPRAAGELRRLPPVRAARPGRRARPRGARRDAAAQLPAPAGRGVGRAVAPGAGADPRQAASTLYAIDAGRIAREVGLAGRINIVLQTCFFAISGVLPREQAIDRIKAAIAKTYGRRGAEVVERNQAAVDRALDGLHRVDVPERVDGDARAAAGRARARARVRAHRHRGDDGRPRRRAAGQRAAGRRHLPERHDGLREAQHLRARRGLGPRPVHPVRQLQLRLPAQRDPLAGTTTRPRLDGAPDGVPVGAARRRRPARHPLHAAGLRRGLHRLRAVRRGVPGRRRPATRSARRSTSRRASRWSPPSARTSRSSRRCRRTTGRGSTSAPCAAPSSSSRCSSSPAPAPAAARRRT